MTIQLTNIDDAALDALIDVTSELAAARETEKRLHDWWAQEVGKHDTFRLRRERATEDDRPPLMTIAATAAHAAVRKDVEAAKARQQTHLAALAAWFEEHGEVDDGRTDKGNNITDHSAVVWFNQKLDGQEYPTWILSVPAFSLDTLDAAKSAALAAQERIEAALDTEHWDIRRKDAGGWSP